MLLPTRHMSTMQTQCRSSNRCPSQQVAGLVLLLLTIAGSWYLTFWVGFWGWLLSVPVAFWIVPGFAALYAITRVTITSGYRKCASIRAIQLESDGTPVLAGSTAAAGGRQRLALLVRPLPMVGLSNVLFQYVYGRLMATFLGLDFACERPIGKPFAELPLYVPCDASPLGCSLNEAVERQEEKSTRLRRRSAKLDRVRPARMRRQASREVPDLAAVERGAMRTARMLRQSSLDSQGSASASDGEDEGDTSGLSSAGAG